MSEDAIKERIEVYRMAFENLHKQAIADLEKLTGQEARKPNGHRGLEQQGSSNSLRPRPRRGRKGGALE
jgi:hypothetical protein